MLPLTGYADRLSVRPGETIRFHVANATGADVEAELVRVVCADANPAGPGILVEAVASVPAARAIAGEARVPRGSYARIEDARRCFGPDGFSVTCLVHPTRLAGTRQAIVSCACPSHTCASGGDGVRTDASSIGVPPTGDAAPGSGFTLAIDEQGRLCASFGDGVSRRDVAAVPRPLAERSWHAVWLVVDADAGEVHIGWAAVSPRLGERRSPHVASAALPAGATVADAPLLLAASNPLLPACHFNGKLEAPAVFDRPLTAGEIEAFAGGGIVAGASARWDFSRGVGSSRIEDTGPHGLHGSLVNVPARGMTGARWTGREMCWRHAPWEYAAIHFHEDDVDDCGWPAAFEWTVPEGTRSSTYALMLAADDARENIPFFVAPPKGTATAPVAVLVSTFTYTIYGNHARPEWSRDPQWTADWKAQAAAWGAYPHNPGGHVEYGLSTYNHHTDGSGISIASWHRPMLNVRIGYVTYPYPEIRGSGLRHFPADTHLTAWLEAKGYDYDVITDQELHDEGAAVLEPYRVVTTGTHPEYHTRETLDALEAYRDGGGRLCYLGGNGFYWKVALSPEKRGVIEIRRGEGGIRAWAAEPGEYYNQFDGEYGGLWRRNGRPPQHLTGVGFTAQGNYVGSYYRRRPEADDPRVAWMFDGIEDETFGDHGLGGHGAAGFELDRADKRLGTPAHAVVAASSENHPPDAPWVLVPEEHLTHIVTWPGEPAEKLIRADLTFFETPKGGAVFSTGSITFCGSLPSNGFDNDVSRLLANVLDRFLDPKPFEMPDGGGPVRPSRPSCTG